ncbi:hypothetical protein F5X98DRAFT_43787 [Xylaria grammica]|nr:hypothetical protein F5X98DRAFT_43787 [Xylaria grammica]
MSCTYLHNSFTYIQTHTSPYTIDHRPTQLHLHCYCYCYCYYYYCYPRHKLVTLLTYLLFALNSLFIFTYFFLLFFFCLASLDRPSTFSSGCLCIGLYTLTRTVLYPYRTILPPPINPIYLTAVRQYATRLPTFLLFLISHTSSLPALTCNTNPWYSSSSTAGLRTSQAP